MFMLLFYSKHEPSRVKPFQEKEIGGGRICNEKMERLLKKRSMEIGIVSKEG